MKRKKKTDPALRVCRVFFNKLVPLYLLEVGRDRVPVRGRLHITLIGGRRQTWTIDLTERTIENGARGQADATLETYPCDWVSMIFGSFDWQAGLNDGRVEFGGDPSVISGFFAILAELVVQPPEATRPALARN